MKESEFKELLKQSIDHQWGTFTYYRTVCKNKNLRLDDLNKAIDNGDYFILPGIVSTAFKKSHGLVSDLNDFSRPGIFQVSSSTSGDPSYLYTSQNEYDRITKNYQLTFGINGITKSIAFAPSLRILGGLSKKAGYLGHKSILRMKVALEAAKQYYTMMPITVDINVIKTLFSMALKKNPTIVKMSLEKVIQILRQAERRNEKIAIGGIVLLLKPYLDQLSDGQFHFHRNMHVVFSGGGYSGAKGTIRADKIDKKEFINRIAKVFGIENRYRSTNLKDIYAFTESAAMHEGYWNDDVEDFMFEAWPESRVYIVDPETEKPLKSGKGFLKVISPYEDGLPSAANVSLIQYDIAQIFEMNDNYQVAKFSHITRYQKASVEGCAYKAEGISKM
jgi:phenylacetate-coenzyme A ligase PaaK-like adenylate-forming protein